MLRMIFLGGDSIVYSFWRLKNVRTNILKFIEDRN